VARQRTKSQHVLASRRSFAKGGLGKWFGEEWTDVKTGKECGRSGTSESGRPYPACRPKAVASKISKKEAAKKTGPKRVHLVYNSIRERREHEVYLW
jgi:hypothetical protein